MNGVVMAYLAGSTVVFMAANATLKTYAQKGGMGVLAGALVLFCVGNWLMVRVMRENGLGLAIAMSMIFQLIAITAMAFLWFGERPTGLQMAGLALGVVAIGMIVWPQGSAA
jgi:small multidrug resistance pump